ncbi:MAG: polysaccharide pyruvyl transferase family protein [Cycloclasticus sp.]|nr:polysaccharide pyruvyl transferase family protein [Cycloclasticus sp.]
MNTSAKKRITIGLLWHSITSDNLGVGALTESQIAICQTAALRADVEIHFLIFGTSGNSNYPPMAASFQLGSRISIKQIIRGKSPFVRELEQCDLVLDIGEGDSFADIYGIKRFIFLIVSKVSVLLKSKPLILSPQTIGPFEHWIPRKISAVVMKRCKRIYARDGLSSEYLVNLGLKTNIDESIDVAFRLPFKRPDRKKDCLVRIGINVSGLLFSGGYTENNQFGLTIDYPSHVRELLREWSANPHNEVWLIPHVVPNDGSVEDDVAAIDVLLKEFPSAKKAPLFISPSEAKSFISGMNFMTGARMHACIAAISSGVPVVPMAYSRKFNGLFSSLNYEWIADGKTMNNQEAFSIIMEGFQKRDVLAKLIFEGNKIAQEKLKSYEDYIFQNLCEL